jgi:hypothetical protein
MHIENQNTIATISDDFPTITSWQVDGIDILFPEQILPIDGKQRKRGGIPICFPNFGKPVNYKGAQIPQHGFLRDTKKALAVSQTASDVIVMGGIIDAYDVSYKMNIKMRVHRLFNTPTLTQVLSVWSGNPSQEMPICLGFHPYFKVNRKYLNFLRDGKAMNMDLFSDENLLHAQTFDFNNIFEVQLNEKLSVTMICLDNFETGHQQVCIWSDNPEEYVCIEPIIHNSKLFGTSQGHFVGNKQQEFHVSYACKTW